MNRQEPPPANPGHGRREFLHAAGKVTLGTALAAAIFHGPLGALYARVRFPKPDHQPLENACVEPLTDEEKFVAAVVDTVVPGAKSDPEGKPGALEACAMNLMYDEYYPFVQALPMLLFLADKKASGSYGKKFAKCTLAERTVVLSSVEDSMSLVRLAFRFIRSTFYAANFNMVGAGYLGWPGPNLGYTEHADFSFGEALTKELTTDGNLP